MSLYLDKGSSVIGHTSILNRFIEQIKNNTFPHGLLLVGPKGVGKSTLAYQLIFSLFNLKDLNSDSQVENPIFRRLLNGSHADFKHIQLGFNEEGKAQQEIPLDLIRDVVRFLQTTPLEGGWRVVLIEEADFLGRKTANALLKSLEEPPAKTLLILCTSQEQQVLPTLRSRCQRVVFSKLTDDEVRQVLCGYRSFTDEELSLLIPFSEGAPGRAIMLSHLGGRQFYQEFLGALQAAIEGQHVVLVTFIEKYTQVQTDKDFDPYRAVGYFMSWWLGTYLLEIHQEKDEGLIFEDRQLKSQILKRFPFEFWEQHYHKINYFYHHPHAIGLDRKYCLAVMMLGFIFGPKAYNEGVANEFR